VISDQNGNVITLDDSGITVESAKDLILKAAKDVKIQGANVELKADTAFKASGGSSAEVTGSSTKVNGDSSTVIKGGTVQIN
jgi:phage gp45-like